MTGNAGAQYYRSPTMTRTIFLNCSSDAKTLSLVEKNSLVTEIADLLYDWEPLVDKEMKQCNLCTAGIMR